MRNAVILAAGKSSKLAPFTYEKPKGLFRVRKEILIERQIKQLHMAGVKEIYVVIGYMKEKYFYLEEKYGVSLVVNNAFANKGNLLSLFAVRDILADTYICCADQYFVENPFLEPGESSYRICIQDKAEKKEFRVHFSDCNVITELAIDGKSEYCMVGHAFFHHSFSRKFVELMEKEINDFGVSDLFWEEFYGRHIKELTLYARIYEADSVYEFDSIEDLRSIDQDFLVNLDSAIIDNICWALKCEANQIDEIKVINKGLTNVSFSFRVKDTDYVYRHPGATSGNLVDRESERNVQYLAKERGIDQSVIYMDDSGWKLSYLIEGLIKCDIRKNKRQLKKAMEYLRILHGCGEREIGEIKRFDTVAEALQLMEIASVSKGNLFQEFAELVTKVKKLDSYVKGDNYGYTVCHNDTYSPNYLVTGEDKMYLIDWEYAGMNDPANDLGCILCRDDFSRQEIEDILTEYFGRSLDWKEHRHYVSYIAISGFYWFCWGLYKGSVNDDDGFFFLPAYRSCRRFINMAIESYEKSRDIVWEERQG